MAFKGYISRSSAGISYHSSIKVDGAVTIYSR